MGATDKEYEVPEEPWRMSVYLETASKIVDPSPDFSSQERLNLLNMALKITEKAVQGMNQYKTLLAAEAIVEAANPSERH